MSTTTTKGGYVVNNTNLDIRKQMKENNIRQWQVAEQMGISEFTLSRKLRKELPQEQKDQLLEAVEKLKGEN